MTRDPMCDDPTVDRRPWAWHLVAGGTVRTRGMKKTARGDETPRKRRGSESSLNHSRVKRQDKTQNERLKTQDTRDFRLERDRESFA